MTPAGAVPGSEPDIGVLVRREFSGGVEALRVDVDAMGGRVALFLERSSGKDDLRSLQLGATAPS